MLTTSLFIHTIPVHVDRYGGAGGGRWIFVSRGGGGAFSALTNTPCTRWIVEVVERLQVGCMRPQVA